MPKNVFLSIALCVFCVIISKGQLGSSPGHAQWHLSSKKINGEYDLIFTVTLDKGWHTFSITKIKGVDLEVFPTQIVFKPNNNFSLVGDLTETKPTPEYDKTIDKTVLLHYHKVVFTQRIKLNANSKIKITGKYEYQACNMACENRLMSPLTLICRARQLV